MSTLTLRNGTVLTRVTRASCLARLAAIPLAAQPSPNGRPLSTGPIPYSQGTISRITRRRADCSGLVCYFLDTPPDAPGAYLNAHNTASLVTQQLIRRIDWLELVPGDLVGYCAPDSPGNGGHIAVWLGGDRDPLGWLHIWDHGFGMGPKDRWVRWNRVLSGGWMDPGHIGAWRYAGISEDQPNSGGDDMGLTPEQERWLYNADRIWTAVLYDQAVVTALKSPDGTLVDLPVAAVKRQRDALDALARIEAALARIEAGAGTVTLTPEAVAGLAGIRAAVAALPQALAAELAGRLAA